MRYGPIDELVRGVSRFAVVAVIGGMAAACSADSMRFSETPFANPFGSGTQAEPGMTGSIDAAAPAAAPRMPRSSVSSAPLAPVASAPVYNRPVTTAAAAPAPSRTGGAGWSVEGGTSITVGSADSLSTISDRYGVPGAAILSANGITARDVSAGRRLVIPVYSATGRSVAQASAAPVRQVVAAAPMPQAAPLPQAAPARPRVLAAVPPEPRTTASTEPKTKVRPGREAANALPLVHAAKPATAKAEPAPQAGKVVKSEPLAAAKAVIEAKAKADAKAKPETKVAAAPKSAPAPKVAAVEPAKPAPEPAKVSSRDPESTASVAPAASASDFRWPARGRVISGFTGSNEGINIAVPDGTPVKAAEAGTVAYAGSEVKGYGNLVLIRHDNGYVSAYAHNGDIDVKRGQKVARGQTIAKSGQTGNVTSPQIHFEIRKGSTPVDPMKYLASN